MVRVSLVARAGVNPPNRRGNGLGYTAGSFSQPVMFSDAMSSTPAPDKPWGGRFTAPTNAFVEEFTASVSFDQRLALLVQRELDWRDGWRCAISAVPSPMPACCRNAAC